jgi:hypothetical protein
MSTDILFCKSCCEGTDVKLWWEGCAANSVVLHMGGSWGVWTMMEDMQERWRNSA